MNLREFEFAVVADGTPSAQERLHAARRAEELGYRTFLMADHFYLEEPVTTLQAVANATGLLVGSHVFCNDFRHPVVLARQVASLDACSGGRFSQLGLGCGYFAPEYLQAGIAYEAPGVRIARFEEALQILKAYFQDEDVTFSGTYYQVQGLKTAIKSAQRPHPPIYIGGGGKRVLSIAAREADIVGLVARNNAHGLDWTTALVDATQEKLNWVQQAAGARFDALKFSSTIFIAAVTDHSQGAAQGIAHKLGLESPAQVFDCTHMLVGSVDQIVEELQRRREILGISRIEVLEPHMEALAPVVARLAGN